jgi:tetratricopeptide (TPR) repeat protein/predicted membrane-bound spermidine synthase
MVLELVAGRLIARTLGSSLYTWTAVIGVILAGITIGNYLGGRIADNSPARKSIASLFAACSITCVATVILNNTIGKWVWLWHLEYFSWPLYVFIHVSLVFLLPSTLLGTISPVVAKMALDRGLPTGRTIGDIYAWGAAGSIAGTLAAGYWLIAAMGTITIIWTIGAVLLLMSILYWARSWVLYIWAIVFIALMTMAMIPAEWAKSTSSSIALRKRPDPSVLYEDESRYSHIFVEQSADNPNRRFFNQDKLKHSEILMNDILNLQYFYTKIYAAATEGLSGNKEKLCIMAIGGGGYVFPRYVEKVWPGSRIDVVEIDPAVTRAAMEAFGLQKDTTINTINMDARNYVDNLLKQKQAGKEIPQYDFIYGDAFNDYSVPFQLVTKEFNDKISAILDDDGVYMINVVDIFDSGLFVGSVINTLEETFPYVYVVTRDESRSSRNTFIIIAAKHKLDSKNIISQYKREKLKVWYLDVSDISKLRQKSRQLVLTDDHSPVENLLAPVVRDNAKMISAKKFFDQAKELNEKGQFAESIENHLSAIKMDPVFSVQSYNEIGVMYARMDNLEQAAEAFNKALQYNGKSERKIRASIHYSLGVVLKDLGKSEQAMEQFHEAAEEFRRELTENPNHPENWNILGDILVTIGDFEAATEAFEKARDLNPAAEAYYDNLVTALERDGRYNEAIEVLKKQIQLMKHNKQDEAVSRLQRYLESLEYKNSKSKQPD